MDDKNGGGEGSMGRLNARTFPDKFYFKRIREPNLLSEFIYFYNSQSEKLITGKKKEYCSTNNKGYRVLLKTLSLDHYCVTNM